MADGDKEVVITIKGKNLTEPEFKAAREALAGLSREADKTQKSARALPAEFRNIGASAKGAYTDLSRVNQLFNQFAGNDTRKRAEDMAGAIRKVGGAAQLTAADQRMANRELQLFLAKEAELNRPVPPHLQQLALQLRLLTKEANAAQTALGSSPKTIANFGQGISSTLGPIKAFAGAMGLTFGVAGAVQWAKHTADWADEISSLAERMSVTVEEAQRFKAAARQTNIDLAEVSKAVVEASQNVSGGDNKSFNHALRELGVSLDDLRKKQPGRTFREMVDAVAAVKNPMDQARLAGQLWGDQLGAKLLPLIRTGALQIADGMRVMSTETVRRLKDSKQAWQDFTDGLTVDTGHAISKIDMLADAFGALWESMKKPRGLDSAVTDVANQYIEGNSFGIAPPIMGLFLALAKAQAKKTGPNKDINLPVEAPAAGEQTSTPLSDAIDARGKKLQDATIAAQAWVAVIKNAANVGKYSHDVQLEINKEITAGIEAYQAAGRKVPEAMRAIAAETVRLAVLPDAIAKANQEGFKASQAFLGDLAAEAAKHGEAKWKQLDEVLSAAAWANQRSFEIWNAGIDKAGEEAARNVETRWKLIGQGLVVARDLERQLFASRATAFERMQQEADDWRTTQLEALAPLRMMPIEYMKAAVNVELLHRRMLEVGKAQIEVNNLNVKFGIANDLIRMVGASATGTFKAVVQHVGVGADAVFRLASALKMAKGEARDLAVAAASMNAGMSFVSFGIDTVINDINASASAHEAFLARMKALREEAKQLGITWKELTDLRQKAIDSGPKDFWRLDKERLVKNFTDVKSKIDELASATEAFGGVLPKALRPFAQELASLPGLPAEFRKQLEALTGAPAWQKLQERAEALGVSFSDLGPGFNASRLKAIAFGYFHDIEMFMEGEGANFDGIVRGMSDELSKLAVEAEKSGAPLPAQLKKAIDRARELGLLVREDGSAIGELTFREMEDESLNAIKSVLEQIRDLLERSIPAAAEKSAAGIRKAFGRPKEINEGGGTASPDVEDRRRTVFSPDPEPAHHAALGGLFSGPTTIGIEHGRKEMVGDQHFFVPVVAQALAKVMGGRAGGGGVNVYVNIDRISLLDASDLPRHAKVFGAAIAAEIRRSGDLKARFREAQGFTVGHGS